MLDRYSPRAPIAAAPLSVVLLAEQALSDEAAGVLESWQDYLNGLQRPYEILLVLPEKGAPSGEEEPRRFGYAPAQGMGAALRSAIAASRYPLLVFCTWERAFQPAELSELLAAIDPVDGVVGYRVGGAVPVWRRLLDGAQSVLSRIFLGSALEPRRTWLSRAGRRRRWVARWIFGLRLADPECPFRLFRREVLTRLPLQSRGSFVHVEILAKANHLGCLLAEVPVTAAASEVGPEMFSFGREAYALFRHPDFG
jgi:hypothetical protein